MSSSPLPNAQQKSVRPGGAAFVAAGIFLSRIAGLLRERAFAHYFGNSDAADAFKAALKIPNFLQNLFGEGVLSASFIPVYAQKLAEGDEQEARRIAATIANMLFLAVSVLVLIGTLVTPWLIDAIAPGFHGAKRELTIELVRIFFPGTGLLVMSAWCLGVLNSHRRFFLSYVAPVVWNLAIIATLVIWGPGRKQESLAVIAAWGLVAGSFLQFAIQLPRALSLMGRFEFKIWSRLKSVRTVLKNFTPAVLGRGVVQISAYIDNIIASLLPTGAVSAMSFAQQIYLLPVSLFGMSISASELPNLSSAVGTKEEINTYLRDRLGKALRQVAFLVLPSAVAFITVGDTIVALLYQTGEFNAASTRFVWLVLIGYSLGLFASTQSRLYSSTFYSLKDAKTPLRFALVRVSASTVLGLILALQLPRAFNLSVEWATLGITSAASLAGWVEYLLLRRRLQRQIGSVPLDLRFLSSISGASAVAAGLSFAVKQQISTTPLFAALVVLAIFGVIYLGLCLALKVEEANRLVRRLTRKWNL